MKINAIFAVAAMNEGSQVHAFGHKGDLVCRAKEDLQHFKELTNGHPLIMGRKTFESLGSRALPNRHSIVITSQDYESWEAKPMCIKMPSLESALEYCRSGLYATECFVIGGAGLLAEAINKYAETIYLTRFQTETEIDDADTVIDLSEIDWRHWNTTSRHTKELECNILGTSRALVTTTFSEFNRTSRGS